MKRRQFILTSAAGALATRLAPGFSMTGPPSGPNVLWVMLDDCRYDAVSCYGRAGSVTPHIDRLAAEGVRFDAAIVQNTVSIPSRKSMKTGLYAYEVGPVEMGKPPEITPDYIDTEKMARINQSPNLLDAWTQAGMKPVNLGKINGFPNSYDDRGDTDILFGVCGDPTEYFLKKFSADSPYLKSERVYTRKHNWQIGGITEIDPAETETFRLGDWAVNTLKDLAAGNDRFFMRVSFHAPHVPCYVPDEFYIDPSTIDLPMPTQEELGNKPEFEKGPLRTYCGADLTKAQVDLARGTYFGMVSQVDEQVGRMIAELENAGQLDNTIVAFTSDQGFQLGEHGLWKKRVFYEANVRVPLIIRYPKKLPKGVSIFEPVELIDFLPTLLDLSGLKVPAGIRGASLVPLARGEIKKWRRACFSEIDHSQSMYDELRQGTGRRIMLRTKEWKLDYFLDTRVKEKDGALYDLVNDPGEKINLYGNKKYHTILRDLEHLAERWSQGENMLINKM